MPKPKAPKIIQHGQIIRTETLRTGIQIFDVHQN